MTRLNAMERFEVGRTLGRGGMGTVHQAFDNARGTQVALKRLQRVDPTSLLRFKTEFRALANLSHPNLVQLFELVQSEEDYLLSMELVDGPDFLGFVRSQGQADAEVEAGGDTSSIPGTPANDVSPAPKLRDSQPLRQVAQLDERKLRHALRQLAEGLSALHASGHLHRDLKPANVLVFQADERLVICDFGLVVESTVQRSRSLPAPPRTERNSLSTSSTSGEIAGTLAFMSPEQTAGLELTPASDWYAVGAMLYQALTLRVPF
ncbi:MAG TPA: serine/threonine-protein kinase, partial [Polyangiales bacterium]